MMAQRLPDNLTKVSYILDKKDKIKLETAARKAGVSMSSLITEALQNAGVIGRKPKAA